MAVEKNGKLTYRGKGKQAHAADDDDVLDDALLEAGQGSGTRWILIIVGLLIANFVLGYLHLQRRSQRQRPATEEIDAVLHLSDESLQAHIAEHPNGTLVNFHMRDCLHCKKLIPEFAAAAKELAKTSSTSLVSVDAAAAPLALKQYSITRFPTMLWFRRGLLCRDVPPDVRTFETIKRFVNESLQPVSIPFSSNHEFVAAVPQLRSVLKDRASMPVVVGFNHEPAVYEVLEQAGETFRGTTAFLHVKEAVPEDPWIRAYFQDPTKDRAFNASVNVEDLINWLRPHLTKQR